MYKNYPARSVYKLQEIDREFGLVKPGQKALDLGVAPGSWLLYLSQQVGEKGQVVGVDIVDLRIDLPQNTTFILKNVLDEDWLDLAVLKEKYNLVVSDMAPSTTGIHFKDVADSLELSHRALEIVQAVLVKGGHFVCKIFEGEGVSGFVKLVEQYFEKVKRYHPQAVRKGSKEFYLVAKNYQL
ncbi:MAG: RlmE family RNA methyltransferase [Candidatus Gribaldobacteria bacterium]|nr:RlmE family RNA methyltransferase [Candidatus Gribaldobacteria bacterium]